MPIVGFVDSAGKSAATFEEEVKQCGFEKFVVCLLQQSSVAAASGGKDGEEGEYEEYMLRQAEQYYWKNPTKVDLGKLITGRFSISGSFRAPAFHWFLTWNTVKFNFTKHPSVTDAVLNALDNRGNSALFYCHSEHYQSGWSFNRHHLLNLLDDKRFVAVDFPLLPAYGGGVQSLDLPVKAVEALLKRNIASTGLIFANLRQTVNTTRGGVTLLHMVCDEILVDGIAPPTLISLIRSHPEFQGINHIAQPQSINPNGGSEKSNSHNIGKESCVAAVLRKSYNKKRVKVVEALLSRHSSGDRSRDFRSKPDRKLTSMAQDSLDKEAKVKDNGFRARIVAIMARRAVEDASPPQAKSALQRPAKGAAASTKRIIGKQTMAAGGKMVTSMKRITGKRTLAAGGKAVLKKPKQR